MTATYPATRDVIAAADAEEARPRVAWSAIFAGLVMVLAIEVLLNLLGAAIGLGLVRPGSGASPEVSSFGTGAAIWLLASTVIAFVASGFVAARMAGVPTHLDGLFHGLVIWAATLLVTVYLVGAAVGGLVGGAFSTVGGVASAVGDGAKAAAAPAAQAAGVTPDAVQQQVQAYLHPIPQDPAAMSPEDAQKAILASVPDLAKGGDVAAGAKQRIVDIMVAQQKISPDQARQQFEQAQAKLDQARQQAVQAATRAANASAAATSKASYATFFALLIGAFAAALGGVIASPRTPTFGTGRY